MLEGGLPFIAQSSISFPVKVELWYDGGIPLGGGEELTGLLGERSPDNLLIMSCGECA